MTNFANIVFPANVPETGVANLAPSPAAPAVGVAVKEPIAPQGPVTVNSKITVAPNTQEVGQPTKSVNPYNNTDPAIGTAAHTPLLTPIGVSPHFTTPTEDWTYVYGNGGGY